MPLKTVLILPDTEIAMIKNNENQVNDTASLAPSVNSSRGLAGYGLFFLLTMAVGAVAAFGWSNRTAAIEVVETANEQREALIAGEVGPVTYVFNHDDFFLMEAFAQANPEIMGVEMYRFPNTIAIAFEDPSTPMINTVRGLPGVERMMQKPVPMLCHTATASTASSTQE